MSRLVVSKLCLRNTLFACFLCSVVLVLFLNRPSYLNEYVSAVLAAERPPTTTELMAAQVQQLERQKLLDEKCRETSAAKKPSKPPPVRFGIEDRHRVLYCFVPKVASKNMVRLMLILSGAVETDDLSSIPRSKVFEENPMRKFFANNLNDTIKNGVGDFTKFLFVRHPFERLVSAYQDKLTGGDTYYEKTVGRKIVRKYRPHASKLSLQKGDDVTFLEFVTFVIEEWRDGKRPLDIHWRPVVDLCLPCEMQFDFIGKFETLNQDVDFLLRKLNATDLVGLFSDQPKAQTTSSVWKEVMDRISRQQLSELNRMYADDFRLFGYPHYYYVGQESLP